MARKTRRDRIAVYQDEINRAKTWRTDNGYDRLWRRMADLYAGEFLPAVPGEHRVRVNLAFSTVNTVVPSVALNHPKINITARNERDGDRAVINERVLNYWWNHYGYHEEFKQAVKDSVIFGFGWVKVGWLYAEEDQPISVEEQAELLQQAIAERDDAALRDPGMAAELPSDEDLAASIPTMVSKPTVDQAFVSRISPSDVYVSPEATDMNDARWIAQRILRRREDVENDERYSPKARKDAKGGIEEGDRGDTDPRILDHHRYVSDEWVIVWEYYDIESGEMSVFVDGADDFLIRPRRIPFAYGHPFEMLRNYDVPDKFYPKGDLEEIEDLILEQSLTRSQMQQWREKYASKYLIRDGAIDRADYAKFTSRVDGQIIPVKDDNADLNDVVVPVPINQLDARLFDWSAQVRSDINEVSGITDIQRGIGGSAETATEASLVQDALNARAQERLTSVEAFISKIARKLQQLGQQFLTGEHFVRVVGPENADMYVPYGRDDVTGEYDFKVEAGSTQPQNDTYKRQQGIALMQTMMPFLEMGVVDPLKLAEHVMRDSFNIQNAQQFLTPQAYMALQQTKQMEAQMNAQQQAQSQQGAPSQPGALGAPGNGVGVDAPQPTTADRQDLGVASNDRPRTS